EVLVSAPSTIFDGTGSEPAGANAWQALRRQPTMISTRDLGQIVTSTQMSARPAALGAAELGQHLAKYPPLPAEPVGIDAPVHAGANGLGNVLGIAQSLGLTVDGFIDSAAVAVASVKAARSALVLEMGLHQAAAAAVDSTGQARRRRAVVSEQGGLIELY